MKKSTLCFLVFLVSSLSQAQNGLTSYSNPPGLQISSPSASRVNYFDCDPQGNAWVEFFNAGFGKFDGANWTVFDTSNSSLRIKTIRALSHDHQNYIWLATDSGLGRFDGVSSWVWYDSTNSTLATSRILNVYASGNKVLLLAQYITSGLIKLFWLNVPTGVFQQIDISPTVGATSQQYGVLCISPQGNFYIGSPSQKKIVKIDGSGNQTLIDLTSYYNSLTANILYFDVDSTEKIWLSNWRFVDTSMTLQTAQHCDLPPEKLISFGPGLVYVRRSYQDIPWFMLYNGSLSYANANASGYYLFPPSTVLFERMITAPSGETWLTGGGTLYKFNPALYTYTYTPSTTVDNFLDVNDVVGRITPICDMHWDPVDTAGPEYVVPRCSGVSSVFSSALWIGGLDANDTLHLAAQTYRQGGLDFWPGPLDTLSASVDSATSAVYNHVWKINRSDIVNFVYQYQLGNVTNMTYPVPPDFLSWPAQGAGNFSRDLAPFVDYNNDGVYNPYDGDYPKIKGDQMCYSIFNDVLKPHGETGGKPLGLEFHKSSYAAACPQAADSDRVINYTTFYEYEIFNRSDTTYHDMYIGLFADVDLGNYLDDYVGCDTLLNAAFVYNGDNDDDGPNGYGLNPPIQDITILDGPLANPNDGRDNDNDGIIDEPGEEVLMSNFMFYNNDFTNWGNPQTAIHFYDYMESKWKNGQQLTYGGFGNGNGNNPTNIPYNYMFPGTPYDTTQWNETSSGNVPYDRRFVMGCGPFTLPAHGKTKISFAYVWTRDELNPNGINTSIARNRSDLMKIRQWFAADTIPSCLQLYAGVQENTPLKSLFNLYPNPVHETVNIQYAAQSLKPLYRIYDTAGRLVKSDKLQTNISAVNVSALKPGNYVFEITDGDIKTAQRFVKE